MQYCQCLPGLQAVPAAHMNGLSRIQCVPSVRQQVTAIVVYTILGAATLAAVVAVAPIIIRKIRTLRPPGKIAIAFKCMWDSQKSC